MRQVRLDKCNLFNLPDKLRKYAHPTWSKAWTCRLRTDICGVTCPADVCENTCNTLHRKVGRTYFLSYDVINNTDFIIQPKQWLTYHYYINQDGFFYHLILITYWVGKISFHNLFFYCFIYCLKYCYTIQCTFINHNSQQYRRIKNFAHAPTNFHHKI